MTLVYLALGSNLAEPLRQVESALLALNAVPQTSLIRLSAFYRTPPYGPPYQPDFLNAVAELDTALTPLALLDHTQRIELEQGRERKAERWGPRTIDLDILLFGDLTLNTPRLILPHYDMHNRAFMLLPLVELSPGITLPNGKKAADLLAGLDSSTIRFW
ncbi:2-amino-4-hydroxy-6-hydroxymethyldihydropteridinediphosphokinase [Izhakiella capsodis]|uniref:2-amino-4-hydroxy-6-hydroxymethyldihydropteridine pyrophosphokinase n=1 Tax=Izhakiella capsodis TaxID=1367852 RepID=A0A1I4WSZ0_9GAMM|nr:2-amino-4-hydroxy-6-hydroxymethyldihydropteridine diphosphokinase [Izhakiella capsodis]SFN16944.1 2-amino-4-hydroxy-6-hydroxymethyldihydropteridinediphosphokinase [Izhakiella capsodis]